MVENLEATLTKVNKFINIDQNRAFYTAHYDTLRNTIFDQLRKEEPFKKLFNGHSLQGSYGDNLKVKMPNEFDSVFMLKLPETKLVKITKDCQNAGNVHINLTDSLEKIKNEVQHSVTYQNLKKWVNEKNFLIVEKVQSWLTSCFQKVLTQLNNQITVKNRVAELSYKRQGPAHTISVTGNDDFFYSVDFVPGFLFSEEQNVIKNMKGTWLAVPKPLKPPQPKSTSFRSSFFVQESELIRDKKNLKNVLRMMKKFRDCHTNLNNLKSYYIKTIFLMKAKEHVNNKSYWENSISTIVIDMFQELEKVLLQKKLLFFWDRHCDMIEVFSEKQLDEMRKCVTNAKETLLRGQSNMSEAVQFKIYSLFLTANEREQEKIFRPNSTKLNNNFIEEQTVLQKNSEASKGNTRCCIA